MATTPNLVSERDTIDSLGEKLDNLYTLMPELISASHTLRNIYYELERVIDVDALTNLDLGDFGEKLNQFDQLIENLATTLGYQVETQEMQNLTIEEKFALLHTITLCIREQLLRNG